MIPVLPNRRDRTPIVALVLLLHVLPFAWLHWRADAAVHIAPPSALEVRVLTESAPPAPASLPPLPTPVAPALPTRPDMAIPEVQITAPAPARPMAAELAPATVAAAPPAPAPPASGAATATKRAANPATNALPVTPPSADSAALNNRPPSYPSMSRRLGEQGRVLLSVWVERDGRVGEVRLHRGSGYPLLDQAAIDAVRHWRYQPATRGDEALATWYVQQVDFVLGP